MEKNSEINENSQTILTVNRFLIPSLSKSEKKAAKLLSESPEDVIHMTLAEYAESAGVSQASVLRFCRRFNVSGYPDFKMKVLIALRDEQHSPIFQHEVTEDDSMQQILEKVFLFNIQTLKDTLALYSDDYEKALKALGCAETIHFFAIGDAAIPAELACIKFRRLGIISTINIDADMQLMTACVMKPEDVAIAISFSGKTKSVVESMRIAKERGVTTICITKMKKSPLIKYCDIALFTATIDITTGKEIIGRRVAEQGIMEALYVALATKIKKNSQESIRKTAEVMKFNKY